MPHWLSWSRTICIAAAFSLALGAPCANAQDLYWPTEGWRHSSPEAQGLDSAVLAEAIDYARQSQTPIHSLTIVRNGYLVLDAYFWPFQDGQRHDLASVTKSITTTLVGIAIGRGEFVGVDQTLPSLFEGEAIANLDERKRRITLEHLLTMSSGLDCSAASGEITLFQMRASADWVRYMLNLPMRDEPGSRFEYCSGGMHLLSGALTRATGESALDYGLRELFAPLGISNVAWPADAQGVSHGWGDLQLEPRDMAKIGYLWLHEGQWEQRQLVPRDWMRTAIQAHTQPPRRNQGYGYGIWTWRDRNPMEYEATGRGGQRIVVVPDRDLVIVFTGGEFEPGDVGAFIARALRGDEPLPENPVALAQLNAAIAAAASPTRPSDYVSPLAAQISGRRYQVQSNPLGLTALTLTFTSATTPELILEFADRVDVPRPIGPLGAPRISAPGSSGLPVALSGAWRSDDVFVLEYNTIGGINTFAFGLRFSGDDLYVTLSERSRVIAPSRFGGHAQR